MTPEEFQALLTGQKPGRELRVEVKVYERRFDPTPGVPDAKRWSAWTHHASHNVEGAAIKVERVSGNNGESITVVIAGVPEATLADMKIEGRPS